MWYNGEKIVSGEAMKIVILGIVASGKTTLAKKLSRKLNIPYFEGDCIAWGFPDEKRYKRPGEEQKNRIAQINKNPSWIIEGTYRESQRCAYDLADKIIFLDTPLYKRRRRIVTRFVKQKIGLEKSHYKPTIEMLKQMFQWTDDFQKNRESFERLLSGYEDKLIWILAEKEINGKL